MEPDALRYELILATVLLKLLLALTACNYVDATLGSDIDDDYLVELVSRESLALTDKIAFLISDELHIVSAEGVDMIDLYGAYEVVWSPGGDALLINLKQPGSNPLYDLIVVNEGDWLNREYILSSVFMCDGIDWSPSGDRIAYIGALPEALWRESEVGETGVYTANRDGTNLQLVAACDSADCCIPEWSPNGTQIAFVDEEGIAIIEPGNPTSRQVVRTIVEPGRCPEKNISWFPDSQRLLISDGLRIQVLNLVDDSVTTLFEIDPQTAKGYLWAIMLPDGKHVVYRADYWETACDEDFFACYHREVMLANLDDMVWRDITPDIEDRFGLTYLDWWQAP